MRPETGRALRVIGPLIEVVCLVLLFAFPGRRPAPGGIPLDYGLYAGLALGFAMVVVGLTMVRHPSREQPSQPPPED
jgi:hypothetical protein